MEHRLYRSRRERMVAGVSGGLGAYLGIDPVIVRLFFVIMVLATGYGVLLYLILWLVVPEEPAGAVALEAGASTYRRLDARQRGLLIGGALVALGLFALARELGIWWWASLHRLWPLLLIAAGVVLLIDRTRSA